MQSSKEDLIFTYKYKKHSIALEKQLFKSQDFSLVGSGKDEDGLNFDYLVICDGHSEDTCINAIRTFNFDEIMKKHKPINELNKRLYATFKNFIRSGSTCVLAKIYETHIFIEYVGDSQIIVFIDDECVYLNEPHTLNNESEVKRVEKILLGFYDEKSPKLVSPTRIALLDIKRCVFNEKLCIIPTQAFGHNGVTGFEPTFKRIDFLPKQHVRIIAATDGFWDMIYLQDPEEMNDLKRMSPNELLLKAENRWKQEWIYSEDPNETDQSKITTSNFGNVYDDIAIAFWDNEYPV